MSKSSWEQIATTDGKALRRVPSQSRAVIVLSANGVPSGDVLSADDKQLLSECVRGLRPGGLLFIYGEPRLLPLWGEHLMRAGEQASDMVFKYWIAVKIDNTPRGDFLKRSHRGLLMFVKQQSRQQRRIAPALNIAEVRVPHAFCAACGNNLKDWGGKKHLMNPKGTALSDIWRDLPRIRLHTAAAPDCVLERIRALTAREDAHGLHVIQLPPRASRPGAMVRGMKEIRARPYRAVAPVECDKVLQGDCVSYLRRVAEQNPEGIFGLAFADPPYNLAKRYDSYADELADQHYIEWCNQWLDGMARALKPGGSLFVLNLPKWAIHHAAFLNQRLEFRHWIAWDALSDPRGKLMPAHYALLYYTKPGSKPVFNYSPLGSKVKSDTVSPPDSPKYCLRAACIRDRKARGDDEKVELSDIWFDIHRIKHKRDRDAHPCQLPEKLMERIIRLTTNRGDLVFDPFCGAGTTAIAAAKLGRKFVVVDVDPKYVQITRKNLSAMRQNAKTNGELAIPRRSVTRPRRTVTKRAIELALQNLARELGRMPTEADLENLAPKLLQQIALIYPYPGAALKRARVALAG